MLTGMKRNDQVLKAYIYRHVHTMKVMHIESELIRIVCIHTECAFGQSTSIGGLKPV